MGPDILKIAVIGEEEDPGVILPFLADAYYNVISHGPDSWVVLEILDWIDLVKDVPPLV